MVKEKKSRLPLETYGKARERLLAELKALGWQTSKPDLKVTWAVPPSRGYKLWFRAQAVYKDVHSLFIEIRGLPVERLIEAADR